MVSAGYFSEDRQEHVTVLTFSRPPHNFFNRDAIEELLERLREADGNDDCRATVLAAAGKTFCAGGEFGSGEDGPDAYIGLATRLYEVAIELFTVRKPMVAAVQGAAIGGGLGLALVADFRVTCESARFCANFNRLGIHPGFGLSVTLPRLIGSNLAELLFYTGRRLNGREACAIGLANRLVEADAVLPAAIELAQEIAASAPLAVQDTRETLRQGLVEEIRRVNAVELEKQSRHFLTRDFVEGVQATSERRAPRFEGY